MPVRAPIVGSELAVESGAAVRPKREHDAFTVSLSMY